MTKSKAPLMRFLLFLISLFLLNGCIDISRDTNGEKTDSLFVNFMSLFKSDTAALELSLYGMNSITPGDTIPIIYQKYLKEFSDDNYYYRLQYKPIRKTETPNYIGLMYLRTDKNFNTSVILSTFSLNGHLIDKQLCFSYGNPKSYVESKIKGDTIYLTKAYDVVSAGTEPIFKDRNYTTIAEVKTKVYIDKSGLFKQIPISNKDFTGKKYNLFYKYPVEPPR